MAPGSALVAALLLGSVPCLAQFDEEAFFRPGQQAVFAHFADAKLRCAQGDSASCARLSSRLQWSSTNAEQKGLTDALRAGCAKRIPVACGGAAFSELKYGESNSSAESALEKACMDGDGISCARYGPRLGRGLTAILGARKRGERIVAEACMKQGGWPCFVHAQVLVNDGVNKARDARDLALLERACDGGDGYACFELGLAASEAQAAGYYRKGCDLDLSMSCYNLGWAYKEGKGVPRDEKASLEFRGKGCRLGDSKACDNLANELGREEYYCRMWGAHACYLAVSQETRQHGETAGNAEQIVALSMKAARRGDPAAARTLSHYLKEGERLCNTDKTNANACAAAGAGYAGGWTGTDDGAKTPTLRKERALVFLDRSCAAGAKNVCANSAALRARPTVQ